MKIVVLTGGNSTERAVSLSSGARIADALRGNGHRVLLVDLCRGISALPEDPAALFAQDSGIAPDDFMFAEAAPSAFSAIGENVAQICQAADVVFLALHGGIGEDGTLQAFLDCLGVPYTGSGAVGSMLAMDKDLSKRLFRASGVPTPDWTLFDSENNTFSKPVEAVGYPCVVKPANGGSSVGVFFVNDGEELRRALENAKPFCRYLLVEKRICGRELTVGVLGERVLPPVEILPPDGIYDYQNKYNGKTIEICPAKLPEKILSQLKEYAHLAFGALRLRDYARFDFLLDETERLWCLEGNTLPGMTQTSLLPKEAETVGISYAALCELLVQMSKEREAGEKNPKTWA